MCGVAESYRSWRGVVVQCGGPVLSVASGKDGRLVESMHDWPSYWVPWGYTSYSMDRSGYVLGLDERAGCEGLCQAHVHGSCEVGFTPWLSASR